MFHRKNTVRMAGGDLKRFSRDPITLFKEANNGVVDGVRAARALLKPPVHDVDISKRLEEAFLFGTTNKPTRAGDFAQLQTIGAQRTLKEQEPHIFPGVTQINVGALSRTLFYTPDFPQQLHRAYLSTGPLNNEIFFARFTGAWNDRPNFWGHRVLGQGALEINFGRIGVLLTPSNPLFLDVQNAQGVEITLQLSTAQIG